MEVFCKDCKFLDYVIEQLAYIPVCRYFQNIHVTRYRNWFEEHKTIRYIKKPDEINANNDCSWYKGKI